MFCHGNGNLGDDDGCCWVNGEICPNRLKIVDGRVLSGPSLSDLGATAEYARSRFAGGASRELARRLIQGVTYACEAAINAAVADPNTLADRAAFEAAWTARPEYQPVADAWEAIGRPRDWCATFGPTEQQCCFAEEPHVNAAKAAGLSATAVTLRRAARGGR